MSEKCNKGLVIGTVIVAVILGIMAVTWPQSRLSDIIYISRFFDVMLPVLAVGALLKYLCSGVCSNDK